MGEYFRDLNFLVYWFLFISAIIYSLPFVGKYFRGLNTLVHECGHAFFALITSGKVKKIELFSNTSGLTTTKNSSGVSRFLTSFAGYPFSSIVGYSCFYLFFNGGYMYVLFGLFALCAFSLFFFIRNWYGFFWTLSLLVLIFFSWYSHYQILIFGFVLFLSFVVLVDSWWSSIQLVRIAYKKPKEAGDATNLQVQTKIPALVWALLFVLFSSACLFYCAKLFVGFDFNSLLTI